MPRPQLDAFAVAPPGVAPLLASELRGLGCGAVEPESGGVSFSTSLAGLYRANLHLRTASRVLVRVDEFRASNFHELERRTARIGWEEWLARGESVALRVTCRKSRLYHSGAVAERVSAALARVAGAVVAARPDDEGEEEGDGDGARASPNAVVPQLLVVRLLDDRCTLSIDASGALLHRRGYRQAVVRAPLRENLAAALLLASGWEPETPLVDPFCGSGTIPIEGALMARRIAPGIGRRFAFQRWPGFDAGAWRDIVAAARTMERPAPAPIVGSDRDAGAIEAARANAVRAGVASEIDFDVRPASAIAPPPGAGAGGVITNPPYGVRVGGEQGRDLRDLYARFGHVLRERFGGWRVALLAAEPRLVGQLALPLADVLRTSNGGIAVRALAGSVPVRTEERPASGA